MAASARHPCLYCTATTQDIEASNLRTIGSLKNYYADLKHISEAAKKSVKIKFKMYLNFITFWKYAISMTVFHNISIK